MEKASKTNNYHYNPKLNGLAKANKKTLTKSAAALWKYLLKSKQMMGFTFRRERPILNYIVDFVCLELLLIIEVDGITHENDFTKQKDEIRDKTLHEIGFTVLRFKSSEVLSQMKHVKSDIENWIKESEKKSENSHT